MDEKFLQQRLDVIDAEIHAVMKRQAFLLAAIAVLSKTQTQVDRMAECSEGMLDALDDVCQKISNIMDMNYEKFKKEKASGQGKDLGADK